MKKLPLGIQTFKTMINENYIYVDKTADIYNLITTDRYYFLSRPRRFGKSLLVSTLREIFSGNRQLFDGLSISKTDYNWATYPIVSIDFSTLAHSTPEDLKKSIFWTLDQIGASYNLDITTAPTIEAKLTQLITLLATSNQVVILVDEYDYPILTHLTDLPIARQNQEILRSFYTTIKGLTEHVRFILLTALPNSLKLLFFLD